MRVNPKRIQRRSLSYSPRNPRSLEVGAEHYDPDTEVLEKMAAKRVQKATGAYLPLTGGSMSGDINMGNNEFSIGSTGKFGLGGVTPAQKQSTISDPAGGGTQDAEARAAINDLIDVLQTFGFIS